MGIFDLIGAVASIINKMVPDRKEAAILELQELENLLGKALKEGYDIQASLLMKRMEDIRMKFPDIT